MSLERNWIGLGVGAAGMMTGLTLSYNIITMPAIRGIKTLSDEDKMQLFSWAYKRGAASMPPLALVSALAYFRTAHAVGQRDSRFRLLTGAGVSALAIVPWTILFMKPTNDRLHKKSGVPGQVEIAYLLNKWVGLHWVRIALSAVSMCSGLWVLVNS